MENQKDMEMTRSLGLQGSERDDHQCYGSSRILAWATLTRPQIKLVFI